jgi:Predicted archaeal kinase
MKILKIGGSILTREKEIREEVIERITSEISSSWGELILIHGVGYFGHPQASLCKLNEGLCSDNKSGVYETHRAVIELNKKILDSFADKGVPVIPIHPLSCITGKDGRIDSFNIRCIELAVKNGFLPVLHGDIVSDCVKGCCIVSGDQLVSYIARKFSHAQKSSICNHIEKIGVATNVDGVYDKEGKIIREINPSNLKTILNQRFEGGRSTM